MIRTLGYSLLLGIAFALGWLAFAATRGQDGRMPVTDWMDPLLAGATLGVVLLAITAVIVLWDRIPATRTRTAGAAGLLTAQWMYITGEVLSNTITIGEPPADIGSLLEISAGAVAVLAVLALSFALWHKAILVVAAILGIGMGWWFSHPIDQSRPGAPDCMPGNALYNATHKC